MKDSTKCQVCDRKYGYLWPSKNICNACGKVRKLSQFKHYNISAIRQTSMLTSMLASINSQFCNLLGYGTLPIWLGTFRFWPIRIYWPQTTANQNICSLISLRFNSIVNQIAYITERTGSTNLQHLCLSLYLQLVGYQISLITLVYNQTLYVVGGMQ